MLHDPVAQFQLQHLGLRQLVEERVDVDRARPVFRTAPEMRSNSVTLDSHIDVVTEARNSVGNHRLRSKQVPPHAQRFETSLQVLEQLESTAPCP